MKRFSIKNIIFFVIVILLLVPQSRQQIQIVLHKGFAMFSPSKTNEIEQISSYNWKLKDLDGNTFDFSDSKGKVTLVNIWATWCPPCIAEMPSIQALSDDYKDKISIVLVSKEKQGVLKNFLKKEDYQLQVYTPITTFPKTFKVWSIPRTFLLDKEGNIIIDESGAANWNSEQVRNTIDELLKL